MKFPKLTKKRVIIASVFVIVVVIIVTQFVVPKKSATGSSDAASTDQSAASDSLTADATLVPGDYAELSFGATFEGTVGAVAFKEGDSVTKGQLLLSVQNSEVVQGLESSKLAARVDLTQAQLTLNQLKAKPTTTEVDTAQQAVKDAQARLDVLKASGTATASEVSAAEYAATAAQNNVIEVNKGASTDELNVARAGMNKAQHAYDILVAEVDANKTASDASKYELRSPINGKVVFVGAKVGEAIKGGTILVRVADMSSWKLKTTNITEADVYKIKPSQNITFALDAIADEKFEGTVETVQSFGSSDNGDVTYPVVIKVAKNDERFRWGMLSSITFPTQ